jgi:hypothetical protein
MTFRRELKFTGFLTGGFRPAPGGACSRRFLVALSMVQRLRSSILKANRQGSKGENHSDGATAAALTAHPSAVPAGFAKAIFGAKPVGSSHFPQDSRR